MPRSAADLVLLFLTTGTAVACCFFLVADAVHPQPAGPRCLPRERDALLEFKRGTNGTNGYGALTSWRKRDRHCCRWRGVTCSNITGHVIELDLGRTYLEGQISPSLLSLEHLEYLDLSGNYLLGPKGHVPAFLGSLKNLRHLDLSYIELSGTVPTQLANLSKLEYLDLSKTSLLGPNGRGPEFLSSLQNLRHLDLSHTSFSGRLSPQLANLSKLEYLDLSQTNLSGALPPQLGNLSNLRHLDLSFTQNMHASDISWLTNLPLLEYVDMGNINLSNIDVLPVVNTIPSLKTLNLFNCSLPNAIQSLTHLNLTKLEDLDLSSNYFGHPIETSWFWNLTSLKYLKLAETYLYGPFPNALGGMTSLKYLVFEDNGNAATMTVDLKNLCELENLLLGRSLAFANITEIVKNLPQCSSEKLQFLSLNDNNITGMLPDKMGHLRNLIILDLSNNSITGAIPAELGNFTSLYKLRLSLNRLTGQIPTLSRSLAELEIFMNCLSGPLPFDFGAPNLQVLSLSSNYITGQVSSNICQLQDLLFLDLSNNRFVGEFPLCSPMPNMEILRLSGNNFSGNFPSSLQNSSQLTFIDLAMNKFNGTLPVWIGDLVNLQFLLLSNNMFYGDIPVNITNLTLLQHFSLASNNISGSIPWSLSKLTAMTLEHPTRPDSYWYGRYAYHPYLDILSVVMKQQNLKYKAAAVTEMVGIDLSLNHLTGEIPDEITSLNGLLNLNLSWNHLSGKIPVKIGDMKSLESLDFSWNNLSGEIPLSLPQLTYLSSLELSYNNLTGRIPLGRQLDTLYIENPSMYDGNIGLCGPPLERNCSGDNAPMHDNEKRSAKVYEPVMFFCFGLGSGFVAGLWIVFCALLFKKAWRVTYFRLFDELYDNMYVFVSVTWGRISIKATRKYDLREIK